MSFNHFVDAAVDKAAAAAKMKVKSLIGGGGNTKEPSKSGGMGGLFPSSDNSGNDGKEKKGGLFGGLFSSPDGQNPEHSGGVQGGAAGGAESQDFNSAVDELAGF